jgi:hypothetical protein
MTSSGPPAILFVIPPPAQLPGDLVCDLWHLGFANLVQQRAPPNIEVHSEVRLSLEPQRADLLLLRRLDAVRQDESARVLRALWFWLARITIVEFKSPVRSSFRPGDLLRLLGYGVQYHAAHIHDVTSPLDLTLVLVVPKITPTLLEEIRHMGWVLVSLGNGYSRINGAEYTLLVAATDEVAVAEKDAFLSIFSHHPVNNPEATWWLRSWMKETNVKQNIEDIPGYDEMCRTLTELMPVEKIMANFTPEQRLAGLPPEQRLAGLSPEQVLLALPLEVLRSLPADYLRSLPPSIEQEIRRRIARSGE